MFVIDKNLKKELNSKKYIQEPIIYFSLNTYSLNYYFIAQIFFLGEVNKIRKCKFAFIINDISTKKSPNLNPAESPAQITQIYALANIFGIQKENLKIHTFSEAWEKYLRTNPNNHFELLSELAFLNQEISIIPPEVSELDYIQPNENYEIHYIMQKFIDYLISANYQKIFPEDFKKEINFMLASQFSYPLLKKIRDKLIRSSNSYYSLPPAFPLPPIPYFGKSKNIFPLYIVPNIYMQKTEIHRAIDLYSLTPKQVYLIFNNFILHQNDDLTVKTSRDFLKKLTLSTRSLQKQILTEELYKVLQKIKLKITDNNNQLELSKSTKVSSELLSILKSKKTLQILALCNGENRITDIAKFLQMQQPNVSKVITLLKNAQIVEIRNNKPVKVVSKISFDL